MNPRHKPPIGRLAQIDIDFQLECGWLKAPIDEILFNSRLSGQARLLWCWLASTERNSRQVSWHSCELKMGCGTKNRRECLAQLEEEGFISISVDGKTVTMHDPVVAYETSRRFVTDEICQECNKLKGEPVEKIELVQTVANNTIKPKDTSNEKTVIIEAWNACKPETFSKIRVLSNKQRECAIKHLKNLGLEKKELAEFICAVCRGLKASNFWTRTVDKPSRNFNAVFGYGSPNDTKMKNVENLYLDGESLEDKPIEERPVEYDEKQQVLIDSIKALDYQIRMNDPDDDCTKRFIKLKIEDIKSLEESGIKWEDI